MIPQTIRLWLIEKPRPYALRLHAEDGETSMVNVGSQTFVKLATTVCAMNPTLIEALDERGAVLRATKGETDELAPESPLPRAPTNAAPTLVDTATLQLVAKLLADAYKHSTEVAFERLADLFNSVNKRSETLERSLALSERMRLRQAEDVINSGAGEEQGGIGELVREVLSAGLPQNTKTTNGKGH